MITILIVDDHPIVGEGTKRLLASEADFSVDFLGASVEMIHSIKEFKYDVYLLDLHMPELSGLELTKEIVTVHQDAKVLIFTGDDISCHFNNLVEIGVSGFISKSCSKQQLVRAIRSVDDDQAVIPLEILHQLRRTELKPVIENGKEITLTKKEEEILVKVAKGLSNEQIAKELFVGRRSVERHLTGLFKKLNVSSRAEVVVKGRTLGLIPEVIV